MAKNGTLTGSSSKVLIALSSPTPSASPTVLPSPYDYPCTVTKHILLCGYINTRFNLGWRVVHLGIERPRYLKVTLVIWNF